MGKDKLTDIKAFSDGYDFAVDRACEWLLNVADNYSVEITDAIKNDIVPNLRKVMENI